MKSRLYITSAIAFSTLLLLVLSGLTGARTSMELAHTNKELTIPELRFLEQMRFGILRIVSSTSEIIVAGIPRSNGKSRGDSTQESVENESYLIKQGGEEFQKALKSLLAIYPDSNLPTYINLTEITHSHEQLISESSRIVHMVKSNADLSKILEAKERFEATEKQTLDVIAYSLEKSQERANKDLDNLNSGISAQRNTLEMLGLLTITILTFYLYYVIHLLAQATDARKHAEQLADEKAREVEMRKNIESRLAAHQKLESLGTLVGGIAHSVNNFLVPIIALSKMLKQDAPEGSEQNKDLSRILLSAEKASNVLREVMAFSRIGAKNISGKCDLVQCLHRSLSIVRSTLPSNILLEEEVITGIVTVAANETEIDAMVLNLVGNAIDAIGLHQGHIRIELRLADLVKGKVEGIPVRLRSGAYAHLSITDDGTGIPEDILSNVFDPFFTTKEIGKGTGLGLSITYGVVSAAGGDITVSSNPGKGTRFDIFLPMQEPREIEIINIVKGCAP